jgi:plasmid stabilization system protein ParE
VLVVRVKPRAERQILKAAEWWATHRPAAPGAIRKDLQAALALLVAEPGIGTRVETSRLPTIRRLYLGRVHYFIYHRVSAQFLDVVAFWHERRDHGPDV